LFPWPVRREIGFYLLWTDYKREDDEVSTAFAKLVYRF